MTNSEVGENTVNLQNGNNQIMKQNSTTDKYQKGQSVFCYVKYVKAISRVIEGKRDRNSFY